MKLVEGVDYTWEGDRMVLSEKFLLKRGFCCKSRCRNCPYTQKSLEGPTNVDFVKSDIDRDTM